MHCYDRKNLWEQVVWDVGLAQNVRRVVIQQQSELRPICEKIEVWMRVLGYPRKDIFAVLLALREAVSNAVRHGNRGDPARQVRISYLISPENVLMEVEDQGRGFDPLTVANALTEADSGRPERKRGLFLMRVYMSCVGIIPPGNRIMFGRKRSPS
jgi:serine/threonine-protein kinase RsbW